MPKTKRDVVKRTLAQGAVNLNWAGMYFHDVAEQFRPQHPELAEGLDLACQGLVEVEKLLKAFCELAWYQPEPNWEVWAGTNRPRAGDLAEQIDIYPDPDESEYFKGEGLDEGDKSPSE